jgi:hypothetical protein
MTTTATKVAKTKRLLVYGRLAVIKITGVMPTRPGMDYSRLRSVCAVGPASWDNGKLAHDGCLLTLECDAFALAGEMNACSRIADSEHVETRIYARRRFHALAMRHKGYFTFEDAA